MMHRFRVRIFARAVRGTFVDREEEAKRQGGKMREDPAEVRNWEKVSPVVESATFPARILPTDLFLELPTTRLSPRRLS